jgi:YfiR/HmsC-like
MARVFRRVAARAAHVGFPIVLLVLFAGPGSAADDPVDARQVKAAFVMNFLKFTEWPPEHLGPPPTPLVIAVIGDPALADALEQAAAGESINGHPVVLRRLTRVDGDTGVHLLFIGAAEERNLPVILRAMARSAVLTVGDTDGFARAGVVLNLYTFDQRVRVEVNTTAAARAGIRLSAHLLRIARIIG